MGKTVNNPYAEMSAKERGAIEDMTGMTKAQLSKLKPSELVDAMTASERGKTDERIKALGLCKDVAKWSITDDKQVDNATCITVHALALCGAVYAATEIDIERDLYKFITKKLSE